MTQPTAPFAQFAPRTPVTNPLRAPITAAYRRPEPARPTAPAGWRLAGERLRACKREGCH